MTTPDTSPLISRLSGTFEPANAPGIDLDACRGCGSATLRTPRLSAHGKLWLINCPSCNYLNLARV